MKLIHYGASSYDPEKFKEIKNKISPIGFINKPFGGLWTSPKNSTHSWYQWCLENDFGDTEKSFEIELKKEAKVFKITAPKDLELLPLIVNGTKKGIDFELCKETYDALHLTATGELTTRFSEFCDLYGWDCETVLILNKNAIK